MTLRAAVSFPITTTHDFLFGAAPNERGELAVDFFGQDSAGWCWAACAMMATRHYGVGTPQQVDIAAGSACVNGDAVDARIDAGDISQCWRQLGLTSSMLAGDIPWHELKAEIDLRRIVQVGWRYAGGLEGHVVLVVGYEEDSAGNQWVYVHDPLRKSGGDRLRFSDLQSARGQGSWAATWVT